MKYYLSFLLFIVHFQPVLAQVSGKLTDSANHPVSFATVTLLKTQDSTQLKTVLSDQTGDFQVDIAVPANYMLRVSMMGYETWYSPTFELTATNPGKNFGNIVLKDANKQLAEVVIRSEKPAVEQEPGGLVVNVQNSLLTKGSSVLDALGRSPGVTINPTDNSISLNGKSGVMIMLDGKLMRMSMDQVAALLNGMSADNIDKIELLNTPPAKYDADGNAGLINIVTKKMKKRGTNSSITATAGYGKSEKASTSINLNQATGDINLHGSYSYSHDRGYGALFANGSEKVSAIGGQTSFDYTSFGKPIANYHNGELGADIQLNPRTTIGGSINYSLAYNDNSANNHGFYTLRPDSVLLFNSYLNANTLARALIGDIYLETEFSKDEKLQVDADYIGFKNEGPTEVQSSFLDNQGNPAGAGDSLYANRQRDLLNTRINVGVLKVDFTKQLSANWKLEAGAKGTYTKSAATSGIEKLVNGAWVLSSVGTTSSLATTETIGAAYATLDIRIDTLSSLTVGARYEYSRNSTDKTANPLYVIDRKIGKFFPAIFYSKKLNDYSELQLSYTNRISRPSYNNLASYVTYNDPVSVFTGNPKLKPTITHNFKLGYNYHSYLFSVLYSRDENPILYSQITPGPTRGIVYLSPVNAAWQNSISLQATVPVKINDWWDMSYSLISGSKQYRVDYTPKAFTNTYFSYSVNFSENFKLPYDFGIEISGYYNSPSYYGVSRINNNAILNAGIKKQLDNNKGSFQLSIANILGAPTFTSDIGMLTKDAFNTKAHVNYQAESSFRPVIKLTYYRSFGLTPSKAPKKADSGSKEERERIGN